MTASGSLGTTSPECRSTRHWTSPCWMIVLALHLPEAAALDFPRTQRENPSHFERGMRRPVAKQPSPGRSGSGGGDYAILPSDDHNNNNVEAGRVDDNTGGREAATASALLLDSPRSEEDAYSQDCRLNVFRGVLCVGCHPHPPRYNEARPKHFPSEISVFHTGALYVAIHRAVAGFVPRYNQVYLGLFMSLLILYLIAFWGTAAFFKTTGDGHRHFNWPAYVSHAGAIYVVSMTAAYFLTRPLVKKFHDRMDAVVQEVAPIFRRVGYDLEYHRPEAATRDATSSWFRLCGGCDRQSFVRIVPFSGSMTPEDESRADNLWDPRRRSGELTAPPTMGQVEAPFSTSAGGGFRVAVCGAQAYPGQAGHGRDPNFLYISWLEKLGDTLDEVTWGALATETRSFTDRYHQARQWSVLFGVALCQLPIFVSDAFESWYVTAPYIVAMVFLFAAMHYPSALEVWWLKRVFGVPDLDEMRATIQRLSPLVEERSGYELRLETEPEGRWGGRSTYVYFEPPRGPRAGSAMSLSSSMA